MLVASAFDDDLEGLEGGSSVARAEVVSAAPAPPAGARVLVRAVDEVVPRVDGPVFEVSSNHEVRRAGDLTCKQVHVSQAGPGLCLALSSDDFTYEGIVFDRDYRPLRRFPLHGVPDRARVSADGRYGGFTTFDRGSSRAYFASTDDFSTDTRIVDMRTGTTLVRLADQLAVTRGGRPFAPGDAEFWGVTFAAGGRFYATMASNFVHYLIEGDVATRRARVVRRRVECPSLSPDGRRIAYKRRLPYSNSWRLHVIDLETGRDVRLAEPRSIDDQPEWLDDGTIVYSDDRAVFAVAADGTGRPRRWLGHATSPAVGAP